MSDIPACPFCGKDEIRQIRKDLGGRIQCINEDCENAYKNPMSVEAWNSRPIEDALRAENERLLKALETIANITGVFHVSYISKYAQQALNEVMK